MGRMARRILGLVALVLSLAVVRVPAVQGQATRSADPAILIKARNWIGTAAARAAVKSLEATGTQTLSTGPVYAYHFKYLLPDKYMKDYPGMTHVVSGPDWWSIPPFNPALLPAPVSLDKRHADLNLDSTLFLLTPPPASRVVITAKGRGTAEALAGDIVDIVFPGPLALTFVFDPKDGHPIGYTKPYRIIGATRGDSAGIMTTKLEDYRVVNGVKFPFKITSTYGGHIDATVITSIRVNEGVSAADFGKH